MTPHTPRRQVSSATVMHLTRRQARPVPPQVMGPPCFACSAHRELLRPVHGSWDHGHWHDFVDRGQQLSQPSEQGILAFPQATLLSSGLIYDPQCLYTLDYYQVPATLPGSSATASRYPVALSLIWRAPPDYNHFVVETLPRLLFCRHLLQAYGDSVRVLWYYTLATAYVREYVELLGLQELPFLTTTYDPVEAFTADLMLLPFCYPRDPRTIAYDDPVAWYPLRQDLQDLRATMLARLPHSGTRRRTVIYASRRDVASRAGGWRVGSGGGGRGVVNEAEILPLLQRRYGADLVLFAGHELDIRSTIDLFRSARLVIGPHGGAFANTVFCAPGTALVEFLPALQPTQYYYRTAACLDQQYWPLPIRGCTHQDALEVPPRELLHILDALPARGDLF